MEALRRTSERLDIFCQAGAISAASVAVRSGCAAREIHPRGQATPPRSHLSSEGLGAPLLGFQRGSPSFRLVVLSRNLTASRSWDTVLWLDGHPQGRRPIAEQRTSGKVRSPRCPILLSWSCRPSTSRRARDSGRGSAAGSLGTTGRRSRSPLSSYRDSQVHVPFL